MSDLLTSPDLKTERATEPPKRWTNVWLSTWSFQCVGCGTQHRALVPFRDCCSGPYPSRDVAETLAKRTIASGAMEPGDYVDSVPDGEAP